MPDNTPPSDDQFEHIEDILSKVTGDYNADQIQVLEGLEAVRKRPGMYVGDNGRKGLHQMFKEVIDNSVDEALAGYCDEITIILHKDNSLEVIDNGRGIPVDKHEKMGVSALQVVMTVLHAGGKFGGGGYKTSGGLHGVGVSCTNALSALLVATVRRDGKFYQQAYLQGKPQEDVVEVAEGKSAVGLWAPMYAALPEAAKTPETKPSAAVVEGAPVEDTSEYAETETEAKAAAEAKLVAAAGEVETNWSTYSSNVKSGTSIRWLADCTVLTDTTYDVHIIKTRMRELAYLNSKVKFEFIDHQNPKESQVFFYQRGIPQLVEDLNEGKDSLHPVIYFKRQKDGSEIEVALQYHTGYNQTILAFSNNIHNPDGGTHVSGFSTAVTRVINSYARKMNVLKEKDSNFTSDDVSDGLTGVISLRLENPSYNSQDKVKLVTPEVQGLTNSLVGDGLNTYLEENPNVAKRILDKAVIAQRAREAARKAAENIRRSNSMDSFGLPGKLTDCMSKNPEECEIFLVEGDSAGGSAKGARDRRTQAVLPLRGKILNVERARLDKALDNEEIKALISALGVGIDLTLGRTKSEPTDKEELDFEMIVGDDGEPEVEAEVEKKPAVAHHFKSAKKGKERNENDIMFDIAKLRYNKIVIMTDADVDGEHIRTLLLTFFYRYMKPLMLEGHIYLAQPPLFVIKVGNNERHYAMTEEERDEIVRGLKKGREVQITRFKGLGEMDADQLEETTMNPEKRHLLRIKLDNAEEAGSVDEAEIIFSKLMGEKVEPRRQFIEAHARTSESVDWDY